MHAYVRHDLREREKKLVKQCEFSASRESVRSHRRGPTTVLRLITESWWIKISSDRLCENYASGMDWSWVDRSETNVSTNCVVDGDPVPHYELSSLLEGLTMERNGAEMEERRCIRDTGRTLKKYGSTAKHTTRTESLAKHTVCPTDTLQGIALKYGVTVKTSRTHKHLVCSFHFYFFCIIFLYFFVVHFLACKCCVSIIVLIKTISVHVDSKSFLFFALADGTNKEN